MNVLPYSKENKPLMVDVQSAFVQTPEVKVTSNTLTYNGTTLTFTNGTTNVTVNGNPHTLSVSPELNNGRQMLPIREVAKLIGLETRLVIFGKTKRIEILNYVPEYSDNYWILTDDGPKKVN